MCMPTCTTPSGSQSHCPSCHHTFKGVEEFDSHRERGHCLPVRTRTSSPDRGTLAGRAPQGGTRAGRIPEGRTLNGRRIPQ